MKKLFVGSILFVFALALFGCNQKPPDPGAFRLKTRVKFRLFGFIPLFNIPAPGQQVNLKTPTAPGAPNTIGNKNEFAPLGAYVTTDVVGKYDAVGAVMPAVWTAKVNPQQPIRYPCAYPATIQFAAADRKTYKYHCDIDIVRTSIAFPDSIYVNRFGAITDGNNQPVNWSVKINNFTGEKFPNSSNYKVKFYRLTGIDNTYGDNEEIYQLESESAPISVASDGADVILPFPNGFHSATGFLLSGTTKLYNVVVLADDTYVTHTTFSVSYPENNCNRTRTCP